MEFEDQLNIFWISSSHGKISANSNQILIYDIGF